MHFSMFTAKTESFYTACSPELAVITYGECRDEAVNNLRDEVCIRELMDRAMERAIFSGHCFPSLARPVFLR